MPANDKGAANEVQNRRDWEPEGNTPRQTNSPVAVVLLSVLYAAVVCSFPGVGTVSHEETLAKLRERFGADGFTTSEFRDNRRVHVAPERLFQMVGYLKATLGFDMLVELSAADYLHYPDAKDRYGVWYILLNTSTGQRLYVKTFVNDPEPAVPSVYPLWHGADWMEREVYDMYGIVFDGHPDLRRILLPDEFTSFPLRKDYPMRGRGERHNFTTLTRAEG
jgi:NADH-quinone oxidoreductase subunit C